MTNVGILLPISIVAAAIAYFYGRSIRHALLPTIITFACTLLGGLLYKRYQGIGQILGIVVSALIIFFAFTLPEQRRVQREQRAKARDASQLPNEEDI